jgi:hypothetical protein
MFNCPGFFGIQIASVQAKHVQEFLAFTDLDHGFQIFNVKHSGALALGKQMRHSLKFRRLKNILYVNM